MDVPTRTVASEITLSAAPRGLSLSGDGTRLYVALSGVGSVAEVDTATGATLRTLDVSVALNGVNTFDVQLVGANDLFVTAEGISSFTRVAKLDLTTGESKIVASNRIIRAAPRFDWDGADSLFVSEGFSPESLYRLDLSDPDAPLVAEDEHGEVAGTDGAIVAGRGSRVITRRGQELDAVTLDVIGSVPIGRPATGGEGWKLFLAQMMDDDRLRVRKYNLSTHSAMKTYITTCQMTGRVLSDFKVLPGNQVFVAAGRDGLCVVDTAVTVPTCEGLQATLVGTTGADTITGTSGDDVIVALGGNDEIDAGAGNDRVCAGDGNDVVRPGIGNDRVFGESGVDTLSYSDSLTAVTVDLANRRATGSGNDEAFTFENVTGSPHHDFLGGNGAANRIEGGHGNDVIVGGGGADKLFGEDGEDYLRGGKGADVLLGGYNSDLLEGGPGNDTIDGGDGGDSEGDYVTYTNSGSPVTVNLGKGRATGLGTDAIAGVENAQGSEFDDVLIGDKGDNVLVGGRGADTLKGGAGADTLDGWKGADALFGGAGNDLLLGHNGPDTLTGGSGNDLLAGEVGDDTLRGGTGADAATFALSPLPVVVDLRAGTAVGEGSDTLSSIRDVIGSVHGDTIVGDNGRNVLRGLAGNDDIRGLSNDDSLDGGADTDTLRGGSGDDTCAAGESHASCETIVSGDVAAERVLRDAQYRRARPGPNRR